MKEVVLVIDMLNDFIDGKLKCERAQLIIPNIKKLNSAARKNEVGVIYINDAHYGPDFENKRWGPHALKGTKEAEIIEELKPKKGDYIIEKRTYSGFFETGLEPLLRSLNVEKIYLTGLHTNICARHTAADAFFRGYKIIVVEDGLQAFSEKDHKEGLEYLKFAYDAQVKKTQEIIKDWEVEKNA
jgi:nicotinamidase-related amidase